MIWRMAHNLRNNVAKATMFVVCSTETQSSGAATDKASRLAADAGKCAFFARSAGRKTNSAHGDQSRSGQARSFSLITLTGSGHSMSRAGSFQRTPASLGL